MRGRFGDLDEATRARLLAELDDHDVLAARFTREGSLTYERPLHNFTFRVEVREDDEDAALARAEAVAVEALTRAAIPCGRLRVVASDMARVWD